MTARELTSLMFASAVDAYAEEHEVTALAAMVEIERTFGLRELPGSESRVRAAALAAAATGGTVVVFNEGTG